MSSTPKDLRLVYLIVVGVIWTCAVLMFIAFRYMFGEWEWGFHWIFDAIVWWPRIPSIGAIIDFVVPIGIFSGATFAHGLLIWVLGAENVKATAPWYGWVWLGLIILIGTPILGLILYYGGIGVLHYLANLLL